MRGPAAPGPLPPGRTRDELVAEVARALGPVPEGAGVLVAVSGGPDSTALAFLLPEARPDLAVTLGHVRHGLRDDAEDVSAVRTHAAWLGVDLEIEQVTVEPSGAGVEAAARTARYAALRRQAERAGATWLAVAHSADDQAETVLLRLARGSGLVGATAMAPVRDDVVRPLLRVRRGDLRRFVEGEGLPSVEDPMNGDPAFARVLARQEVLPALERLGPDPVGALARFADLVRADADALDRLADVAAGRLVRRYGPGSAVPLDGLAGLDHAVAGRVLRRMIVELRAGEDPPTAAQVAELLALPAGSAVDLPGLSATCGGGWLAMAPQARRTPHEVPLAVPGRTPWDAAGVAVVATTEASATPTGSPQPTLDLPGAWRPPTVRVDPAWLPPGADPTLGQLVAGELPEGTCVRARRRGDRIRTAGGTRKLQDVLVDAGVPRALRDAVPLVATADRVLWVPGIAAAVDVVDAGRSRPAVHLAVSG